MTEPARGLAGIVVVASGLGLMGLAAALVVTPGRAARFLMGFAGSARAHFAEQLLRLLAGAALVAFADSMMFARAFTVFGWVLVVTSLALMILPWRWHQRFGAWAIPLAIRHSRLYALGAFLLGAVILFAAFGAP